MGIKFEANHSGPLRIYQSHSSLNFLDGLLNRVKFELIMNEFMVFTSLGTAEHDVSEWR